MKVGLNEIFECICIYYGVSAHDMRKKKRIAEIIRPRQMFCYIAKEETNYSYSEIGRVIWRDHATVLVSHRKIKDEVKIYPDVRDAYNEVINMIYQEKANPMLESMNNLGRFFRYMKSVPSFELEAA